MASHSLVILDDYQNCSATLVDFSSLKPTIPTTTKRDWIPPDQVIPTLRPYTIIHAMRERTKFPRSVIEQLPNLKFISTTGMVNRGIDLDACKERGIVVSGTVGDGTKSSGTVEQTWGLLLSLARRIQKEDVSMRVGGWQDGIATGLYGKTLGLVGLGKLGSGVAKVGTAFGMKVVGWSPHLNEERAKAAGVQLSPSLEDLLKNSDFVSLHIVLSSSTEGLIGQKELGYMKSSAYLINTSRGPLVNEAALIQALKEKKMRGAGLDVFDVEPLPKDHPYRSMENVVISPHMGYVDDTAYEVFWPQTVENIQAYLDGKPVRLMT